MKKMLVMLALLPALARGAEWVEATQGVDVNIDVDRSSIAKYGKNARKAWIRFKYSVPHKTDTGIAFNRLTQLAAYRCDDKSIATMQQYFFNDEVSTDAVQTRSIDEKSLHYTEVIPDSIGDSMIEFVCKLPMKKK